ncbi:MAG: hypothetical protein JST47_09530 [Bacteroidetes bacterium]|nr:hypothetical protein [Bacteroidota bacterium]
MKKLCISILILFFSISVISQKQTFDVVSFTVPKGWQQKQNSGSVQLLATDKKSGGYIMAIITNASASTATAIENFNSKWKAAIADQIQLDGEPTMQPSSNGNGWDIETGSAGYTDNGGKGNVALLSATGGGQTMSVVIMFNTKQYEKELSAFLNSLELAEVKQNENANSSSASIENEGTTSIVGLWTDYVLETTGYNINGMPQYTAGYLRKEYAFYPDGTYLFRNKQWLTKTKDILFIYESGTYSVNGNRITIIPKGGKGEFWSKTSSTKEWGKLVKSSEYKLENVTCSFKIENDPAYNITRLILSPGKPTQRDGGKYNAPNDPYEFRYSMRELESLIDNPPGLKTGFENKSLTATTSNSTTQISATSNIDFAGTWISRSSSNNPGTSGYIENEYIFANDGTYSFYSKTFNQSISNIILKKEKGTYTVSGKQITINPTSNITEGWSKKNGIDEFGKLISSQKNSLEITTYHFTKHYFEGIQEWNLVLQASAPTTRDGPFSSNTLFSNAWYYSMPSAYKPAIVLPGK